jgi:hypothetical protein
MKHLLRASASAVILALTAFGMTACGSTGDDDDCDETTAAVAQFAVAPDLLTGTGSRGSSGSKPKPPKPPKQAKQAKPQGSKPKGSKPGSKPSSGKSKDSKPKSSKPKGGSHHDDDICDED